MASRPSVSTLAERRICRDEGVVREEAFRLRLEERAFEITRPPKRSRVSGAGVTELRDVAGVDLARGV